eukprot:6198146-Pleurochrysis_carterae.AAC.3
MFCYLGSGWRPLRTYASPRMESGARVSDQPSRISTSPKAQAHEAAASKKHDGERNATECAGNM